MLEGRAAKLSAVARVTIDQIDALKAAAQEQAKVQYHSKLKSVATDGPPIEDRIVGVTYIPLRVDLGDGSSVDFVCFTNFDPKTARYYSDQKVLLTDHINLEKRQPIWDKEPKLFYSFLLGVLCLALIGWMVVAGQGGQIPQVLIAFLGGVAGFFFSTVPSRTEVRPGQAS
jgi:hypothetical protein